MNKDYLLKRKYYFELRNIHVNNCINNEPVYSILCNL